MTRSRGSSGFWNPRHAYLVCGALHRTAATLGPLPYLGDASYSLYLVHPFMLSVVTQIVPNGAWLLLWGAVASVLASVVLYRYVEKPLLILSRTPLRRSVAVS